HGTVCTAFWRQLLAVPESRPRSRGRRHSTLLSSHLLAVSVRCDTWLAALVLRHPAILRALGAAAAVVSARVASHAAGVDCCLRRGAACFGGRRAIGSTRRHTHGQYDRRAHASVIFSRRLLADAARQLAV